MSVTSNKLPLIQFRRLATLIVAVPMLLLAIWTIVTIQGSFAVAASIAAAGFVTSFIIDGRLLFADFAQPSHVRQLLMVQATSVIVASVIIIYAWSGATTLACLSGCSETRVTQVNIEALGFAAILSVIAGLLFLAPSLSVWRRIRQ